MNKSITIRIENFRSLKDVTLELNDVNLFIGPNNSGKTNVFKALQFLGDWLRTGKVENFQDNYFGKKTPLISKEEYEPMAFSIIIGGGKDANNIFRVEFFDQSEIYQLVGTTYNDDRNINLRKRKIEIGSINYQELFYSYQIRLDNYKHLFLINENRGLLELLDKFKNSSSNFLCYKDGTYSSDKDVESYATHCFGIKAFLADANGIERTIEDVFKKIDGFYSLKVEKLKDEAKYEQSLKVSYDASNLVSFIDDMDNNYPHVLDNIKKDFSACISNEFTNFKCPVFSNNGEGVKRKLKFFDSEGNSYWADEVSEGVLYFLAIVCILHQPKPPKFLLLEEPENGIHPRRISKIMDYIFDLAEEKDITVIMTSHSPIVLDEFKDVPENVFVFDKNEETKATEVVKLSDFIENYNKKATEKGLPHFSNDISLGDYWLTGLINGVPSL
jgi:AAA15 family ATPase/GTPase